MVTPPDDAPEPRIPRLLLIANFLSTQGGSRSVLEDLADRLRGRTAGIVQASHLRSGLLRGVHMAVTVIVKRPRYDVAVVDLYSGRAFLWGEVVTWLLRALRCPSVLVLRGGLLPEFAAQYPARVSACLRAADVVIVPSPFLLEKMRPYADKLVLLPNPVDIARYEFRPRRSPKARLMWLRSFHDTYNPTLAVHVLARLRDHVPDVHLTMVGPDKHDGSWQRVEQLARELGVGDRLTMPGGVAKTDVPRWLNQGDIFLNTTNVDNTPVSVLEAMACGLCVVTTNAGGLPYLAEDGVDALLVPPRDVDAMTRAVLRILHNPSLSDTLSRNGRAKAEQFDWMALSVHWEAIFRSLNGGTSTSR